MKIKSLIILACLSVPMISYAGFTDGNELMQWSDAFDSIAHDKSSKITDVNTAIGASKFVGYVTGVVDTAANIAVCPPGSATKEQMLAIVQKYMKRNPEDWTKSAALLVGTALMKAFPCKTK